MLSNQQYLINNKFTLTLSIRSWCFLKSQYSIVEQSSLGFQLIQYEHIRP